MSLNVQFQPSNRPAALNKSNYGESYSLFSYDQRKVLVNTIKEVGLSLTLLIKIYILIDRYTAIVGFTEVTFFLVEKCRVRALKAVIAACSKCERWPSILCGRAEIFSFSFLSDILLHKYSQKSSKVQDTMKNYFVCDAKFRTCLCVL